MQALLPVLCFIAGFALAWLVLRARKQETEATFRALSADAIERNNRSFVDLAKAALAPVRDSLEKVDSKIQEMEKARAGAYAGLTEQVRGTARNAGAASRRDRQPGDGAAHAERARTLGRDPVAPRGGDGRHAGALRLCRADHHRFRRWPPASRRAGAAAGGKDHRRGCQDAARRVSPRDRGPAIPRARRALPITPARCART